MNEARGYSRIPQFAHELVDRRFHIASQSLFSEDLERLSRWGITPPYREPLTAGLVISDQDGKVLYDARAHRRIFSTFDEIPPLVVTSLLFIENRELEDSTGETHNPVVDWGRSAKAAAFYAAKKVGLPLPVEGGSTLATQIEKYQYSDGGRTRSASDKFLQMISATIRVYREGEDTRTQRREIILDYLNSAPLSAAPSYGEVYGIGEGLYAWFGKDLQEVRAALQNGTDEQRAEAFKYLLALICATRAPSYYLKTNPTALEARIDFGSAHRFLCKPTRKLWGNPERFRTVGSPDRSTVLVSRPAAECNAIRRTKSDECNPHAADGYLGRPQSVRSRSSEPHGRNDTECETPERRARRLRKNERSIVR
jgi:membrane peptidoglycan carboxypeptidase